MNNDFFILIKKLSDKLIEQTKTKPAETLQIRQNVQMRNIFT